MPLNRPYQGSSLAWNCNKMVGTLAAFLQTSTIHGLAHLTPISKENKVQRNLGREAVGRKQGQIFLIPQMIRIIRWIFWPPCILVSFALSYIFISSNVSTWYNQPSSISMLSPVMLKVRLCFNYNDTSTHG